MNDPKAPNSAEPHQYFHKQFTQETFIFLTNLLSFNLDSRRFMANAMLNAVYRPLKRREGEMANLGELDRKRLLNVTTLEILAKVYMALEDLGKILISLQRPRRDFPETFVTLEQKRSLAAIGQFATKPEQDVAAIFPLWTPNHYGLKGDHALVLATYNERIATFTKKVLAFFADFIDRHNAAYNRYKHGMPVMVGLEAPSPAKGIDGIVGIIRNGKDMKNAGFILVGDTVIDKFIRLIDDVIYFSKVLVERQLQMVELDGTPPPLLCRQTETETGVTYNAVVFGNIDEDLQKRVTPILDDALKRLSRTKITAKVDVKIDDRKLHEWITFYLREWKVT